MAAQTHRRTVGKTALSGRPVAAEGRRIGGGLVLAAAAAALLVALVALWPALSWTYHLQRAGGLIEAGLEWPAPRRADSLPSATDDAALKRAISHLEAAQRLRPADDYAYRLAGYAYAAQGAWPRAVASFNQARTLAPDNPVIAWEASLIYERIEKVIDRVPHISIMTELATGEVSVDGFRVYAPYCYPGQTQRCYLEETSLTLPFSAFPQEPAQRERALMIYDHAAISVTLEVPAEQPALAFLTGIAGGRTKLQQPATYTIWLAPRGAAATQVFTATVDSAAARRGWQFQSVDLSRWAGQEVTLRFALQVAQTYKDRAERYVWADVEFTSPAAARYGAMLPSPRKVRAWKDAKLDASLFISRGDDARRKRREREAQVWYQRAEVISVP